LHVDRPLARDAVDLEGAGELVAAARRRDVVRPERDGRELLGVEHAQRIGPRQHLLRTRQSLHAALATQHLE
jgi:hypothetical protein